MADDRPQSRSRSPRIIADEAALRALALAYVARYATTRAKLERYLARKLREADCPDLHTKIAGIADAMMAAGFVNDTAYADIKGNSLARRGYGPARVRLALRADGIAPALVDEHCAEMDPVQAAMIFARRKRLGPFSANQQTPDTERRAMAAMMRAGHNPAIAKAVLRGEET